jgi:hypothetical protein
MYRMNASVRRGHWPFFPELGAIANGIKKAVGILPTAAELKTVFRIWR